MQTHRLHSSFALVGRSGQAVYGRVFPRNAAARARPRARGAAAVPGDEGAHGLRPELQRGARASAGRPAALRRASRWGGDASGRAFAMSHGPRRPRAFGPAGTLGAPRAWMRQNGGGALSGPRVIRRSWGRAQDTGEDARRAWGVVGCGRPGVSGGGVVCAGAREVARTCEAACMSRSGKYARSHNGGPHGRGAIVARAQGCDSRTNEARFSSPRLRKLSAAAGRHLTAWRSALSCHGRSRHHR